MIPDGRQEKWNKYFQDYGVNNARLATFELTVDNVLKFLGSKKSGKALDIGCGNGLIDVILAKKTDFEIIACDISEDVLKEARANSERERVKIIFEKQDAYNLNYPDSYFDVVFSFGYSSAASYDKARKGVYRVLKPGGIFICDFINHRSLYKIFFLPKNLILGYAKIREITGIKNKFKKDGFELVSCRYFNTFPPIFKKNIPPDIYIFFEKTVGRLLRPILARTILFCFRKN